MNFSIRFDLPFYILTLFAVASAGISYIMYHNVVSISNSSKATLSTLRAISIFLLLLAVSNLVTDFVRLTSKKRDVFVLVNDSKSMSLNDGTFDRPQITKDALHSIEELSPHFDMVPIIFGGRVMQASNNFDSLKFNQPATNIESALVDVSNNSQQIPGQAAFAILLTDGDYNTGGNPVDIARGLSIPVYSVGIGDSTQSKDIVVRSLIPSPSIYAGKKSLVKAIISSFGFGGKTVTAQLTDDETEINSQNVTLPDNGDVEVSFDYTPSEAGTHVLRVHVAPQKGEANYRNNSATATVEVLKGKYSILLVAGEPAVDVAFIRRNIESSGDFDLSVLVQKDANGFYSPISGPANGTSISADNPSEILSKKYDAVLLYDFPNLHSAETLPMVSDILNSSEVPFAYFAGRDFSSVQVSKLPRLPFSVQHFRSEFSGLQNTQNPENSGVQEIEVGISTVGAETIPASLQPINSLLSSNSDLIPPLYYQRVESMPANAAVPLAVPVLNGVRLGDPILYVSQTGRSAAFLAYGLWRTQLMSSLSGLNSDFLQDFLTTLIRTLISSDKQKLLTVNADKKVYDPSETINMSALLVDQSGSPISDATVDVNIKSEMPHAGKEATRRIMGDIQLDQTGAGSYAGSVSGLGEGKYSYFAHASSGSGFLGSDSGTIIVEPLNTEFVQTSMNAQLLRQISSVTGGEFMTPSEFMHGALHINPEWKEPVRLSNVSKFELLSSLPILAVVIVLLTVEWVLRKIVGLP